YACNAPCTRTTGNRASTSTASAYSLYESCRCLPGRYALVLLECSRCSSPLHLRSFNTLAGNLQSPTLCIAAQLKVGLLFGLSSQLRPRGKTGKRLLGFS